MAVFDVEGYRPRDELVSVGHSTPGRLATRFALRDNRTMVLLVCQERFVSGPEPRDDREAKDLLRRIFADAGWECPRLLDAMAGVPDLYFDRVSQIHLPTWSRGRVVLIGDAAACVSLLAGEGVGLAMTQAYVLAGELASCDSASVERALARYERRLRPLVERKQKAARRFASTFTPATRIGIWLRDQATRLSREGLNRPESRGRLRASRLRAAQLGGGARVLAAKGRGDLIAPSTRAATASQSRTLRFSCRRGSSIERLRTRPGVRCRATS